MMGRYDDFDPQDLDPDTGRPYAGYSSPSLDSSFHDGEMDVDDPPEVRLLNCLLDARQEITNINHAAGETRFNPAITQALDLEIAILEANADDEGEDD